MEFNCNLKCFCFKRERLITIGIRKDLKKKLKFEFPEPHKYKPVLRDILKDVSESIGTLYGEKNEKYLS